MLPLNGILLGIDFGRCYIGIASGQMITSTATPREVIFAKKGSPNWQQFDKIVATWQPVALIIGMPSLPNNAVHHLKPAIENFTHHLIKRYGIPVHYHDESYTTTYAKELIFADGGYRAINNYRLDSIAAKLILEGWLQSNAHLFAT